MKLKRIKFTLFFVLILIIILINGCKKDKKIIQSFEDCLEVGYEIILSHPRKCKTPKGEIFIEDNKIINQEEIVKEKIYEEYIPISIGANRGKSIPYFNEIAKEEDSIGFTESYFESLSSIEKFRKVTQKVEKGKIIFNSPSWKKFQTQFEELKDVIDCVAYDLENWEKSQGENQDIAVSYEKMAEILKENNLCLVAGLSYQLTKKPGSVESASKYADIYNIHAHGFFKTGELEEYAEYLREQALRAKSTNQNIKIEIMVQTSDISEEITVQDIYEKVILPSSDFTDRIMIYQMGGGQEADDKMKELIFLIRHSV
jgi:hypothetical protein